VPHDLRPVIAAVLDEDTVSIEPGCKDSGHEGPLGSLHRARVVAGDPGFRVDRDTGVLKKLVIRSPSGEGKHPVIRHFGLLAGLVGAEDDRASADLGDPMRPQHLYVLVLQSFVDVRQQPGLHPGVAFLAAVNHGDSSSGAKELRGGFDRQVPSADHENVLVPVGVSLVKCMLHLSQPLPWNPCGFGAWNPRIAKTTAFVMRRKLPPSRPSPKT